MTTAQRLDWQDRGLDALAEMTGRRIGVGDGQIGYVAELPAGMTAEEALADFAAGYDAGDYRGEITVCWSLWDGEDEVSGGAWSWDYPITA